MVKLLRQLTFFADHVDDKVLDYKFDTEEDEFWILFKELGILRVFFINGKRFWQLNDDDIFSLTLKGGKEIQYSGRWEFVKVR